MKIDLATASPTAIDTDIAVIGAGAAGITMARCLVAARRRVVLIESGGLDYEQHTAAFNAGTSVGEQYYGLEHARLRFFGGTTAIWGGRCAALRPIDFEERPWVPHSGWPITALELAPWYAEARKSLEVDAEPAPGKLNSIDLDELEVGHWAFDRRFDRFGYAACRELIDDPRLTLLLHATVREIVAAPNGRQVEQLDVRGPGGKRVRVNAQTYVLACGGLENPRILLASNSVQPDGLGNARDLVGRFFMEHPHARGGRVVDASTWQLLSAFRRRRQDGVETAPVLTASPQLQRREGLLNSGVSLAARPPEGGSHSTIKRGYLQARHKMDPTRTGRTLWMGYRRAGRAVKQVTGAVSPWMKIRLGKMDLAIVIRAEQSPNPDSRVMLDRETDAIGMRRIRLDWRLQQLDLDSANGLVDAFGRGLTKSGLGNLEKASWLRNGPERWVNDPLVSIHPIGGYHHMGTTRMADDPARGVTDRWGRVHGLSNLYIAGSSLFPTSGWANPTLTIIALALRSCQKILEPQWTFSPYVAAGRAVAEADPQAGDLMRMS
ncbi:MAG: FAD-dependent oxidoreductase [Sphingomicrobium sp.]